MKRSIFLKIFAGYAIVIAAMVVLTLLLSLRTVRNHHMDMQQSNLRFIARGLEPTFSRALREGSSQMLDSLAKHLGPVTNSRITVIERAGIVLADSWRDPAEMDNHGTRPEIMTAFGGGSGASLRYSATVRADMLYVAVPLEGGEGGPNVLRVSMRLDSIDLALAGLRNEIIAIAAVVVILALLAATLFARSFSRPLDQLTVASHKVASGDFDTRVFLKGRGEIKDLADSFNYMAGRVKSLFGDLSKKTEELRGIVASLQDGLLVLGRDGRIILSNESFQRLAGEDAAEGKFYWEVVRVPQFDELVRSVGEEKADLVREVSLDDKVYLCSGTYLEARDAVIVLVHDITEMKNVEKLKKDFVVNLSHELRTPLTAIKGFLETLQDEVTLDGHHYLEIVRRHTERLTEIVEDLLALSELEDSGISLESADVDLGNLARDVVPVFEQKVKEKGLKLALEAPGEGPIVAGDHFKLEQVLINLIANAIKYTDEGEITVFLRQEDTSALIAVSDTGAGISEEHLPRIFERFYVADKSRSKRVGGTGLGLAIVKHIVLLHNGEIDVRSTPGQGTTFTVTLPLSRIA